MGKVLIIKGADFSAVAIGQIEPPEPSRVSAPVFNPKGGSYTDTVSVEIVCATQGASIYYTLDESTPSMSSELYSAPIVLTAPTTIKAIAVMEGLEDSGVVASTYNVVSSEADNLADLIEWWPVVNNNNGNETNYIKSIEKNTDGSIVITSSKGGGNSSFAVRLPIEYNKSYQMEMTGTGIKNPRLNVGTTSTESGTQKRGFAQDGDRWYVDGGFKFEEDAYLCIQIPYNVEVATITSISLTR